MFQEISTGLFIGLALFVLLLSIFMMIVGTEDKSQHGKAKASEPRGTEGKAKEKAEDIALVSTDDCHWKIWSHLNTFFFINLLCYRLQLLRMLQKIHILHLPNSVAMYSVFLHFPNKMKCTKPIYVLNMTLWLNLIAWWVRFFRYICFTLLLHTKSLSIGTR